MNGLLKKKKDILSQLLGKPLSKQKKIIHILYVRSPPAKKMFLVYYRVQERNKLIKYTFKVFESMKILKKNEINNNILEEVNIKSCFG